MQDSAADRNVAELHDELCAAHPTSNGRWSGSSKVLYTYDNKNGNDGGRPTSLALIPLGLAKALAQAWDRPGGVETRLELAWNGLEQARNKLGTSLEQAWNRLGTGLERARSHSKTWNGLGTRLEQAWNSLAQAWSRLGTGLEHAWKGPGTI